MSTEPTIFEKSRSGRVGVQMPACDVPVIDMDSLLEGGIDGRGLGGSAAAGDICFAGTN